MRLPVPCKKLQEGLDISALREAVLSTTEKEWNENQFRQERFEVARDVESILFKMNGSDLLVGDNASKTEVWEDTWNKWKDLVNPVINQAIRGYKGKEIAFVNKCMIARLRPNKKIEKHIDAALSFNCSHRIHVPLFTNPDVEFIVDGERVIMDEGNAYEISNKDEHSVVNKGSTPRIHLLFDIYIPKE